MPDILPQPKIHEEIFSLHRLLEQLIQSPHPTPDKLYLHDEILPALLPALEELIQRIDKKGQLTSNSLSTLDPLNLLAQILLRLPRPIPRNTPIATYLAQRRPIIEKQLENTESIFEKQQQKRIAEREKVLDEKFAIDLKELNRRLEQWEQVKKQCATESAANNGTLIALIEKMLAWEATGDEKLGVDKQELAIMYQLLSSWGGNDPISTRNLNTAFPQVDPVRVASNISQFTARRFSKLNSPHFAAKLSQVHTDILKRCLDKLDPVHSKVWTSWQNEHSLTPNLTVLLQLFLGHTKDESIIMSALQQLENVIDEVVAEPIKVAEDLSVAQEHLPREEPVEHMEVLEIPQEAVSPIIDTEAIAAQATQVAEREKQMRLSRVLKELLNKLPAQIAPIINIDAMSVKSMEKVVARLEVLAEVNDKLTNAAKNVRMTQPEMESIAKEGLITLEKIVAAEPEGEKSVEKLEAPPPNAAEAVTETINAEPSVIVPTNIETVEDESEAANLMPPEPENAPRVVTPMAVEQPKEAETPIEDVTTGQLTSEVAEVPAPEPEDKAPLPPSSDPIMSKEDTDLEIANTPRGSMKAEFVLPSNEELDVDFEALKYLNMIDDQIKENINELMSLAMYNLNDYLAKVQFALSSVAWVVELGDVDVEYFVPESDTTLWRGGEMHHQTHGALSEDQKLVEKEEEEDAAEGDDDEGHDMATIKLVPRDLVKVEPSEEKEYLFESLRQRKQFHSPNGRIAIPIMSPEGEVLAILSVRPPPPSKDGENSAAQLLRDIQDVAESVQDGLGILAKKQVMFRLERDRLQAELERRQQNPGEAMKADIAEKKVAFTLPEDDGVMLDAEKLGPRARNDLLIPRLLLIAARKRVLLSLSSKAIAELRSYRTPPITIHRVLQCVLFLFDYTPRQLWKWNDTVKFVNADLLKSMVTYDPTSIQKKIKFKRINEILPNIPAGEVRHHGSEPAEALHHWLLVAYSLRQKAVYLRKMAKKDAAAELSDLQSAQKAYTELGKEMFKAGSIHLEPPDPDDSVRRKSIGERMPGEQE